MDGPIHFEPFVDANAVAEHLQIKRRQVLEMTRRSVIRGYPLGTGTSRRVWRYKLSEVDAAVASGSKRPVCATPHEVGPLAADAHLNSIKSGSPRSQKEKSNG